MSAPGEIVLYDLRSKGTPSCISPNVWKARAALNYKRMPYRTHWIAFPDLAETAKTWNVPPNGPEESFFPYSVPAIKLPDGTHLMESLRIAKALEAIQTEPSLRLDTEHHQRALSAMTQLQMALVPPFVYRIRECLNEADGDFMMTERTRQMGASPEEMARNPEISGERAWEKAQAGIQSVKDLLAEDSSGPFVMGREVGFADFVLVGGMKFFEMLDHDGDIHGRLLQECGEGLAELEKACEEWFRRAD